MPRKTHRGYKTCKTWFEGNKKGMNSKGGREKQQLPESKRST